jgi:5-methylcytosine-specific restriction protein A
MWDKFNINIDCIENIVSLCPTCHKAFHYGTDEVKNEIIETIFEKVALKYKSINFNISQDEIKECYGIKKF